RAECVARDDQRTTAVLLELRAQLRGGGGLARAVDSDQANHGRPVGVELDAALGSDERAPQRRCADLGDLAAFEALILLVRGLRLGDYLLGRLVSKIRCEQRLLELLDGRRIQFLGTEDAAGLFGNAADGLGESVF